VYDVHDVQWLEICTNLRASGMPLETIRRYVELVRQGDGNERERLALLRAHREHVTGQIDQLRTCLELINYKIDVYERRVAEGTAGPLWNPHQTDDRS
jgi:DNA-binding transcriptional MerR regulator